MYDLIDIIDVKLSGMDRLIHKWMTNHQLIKSTLLDDIKSIKNTINKYHNKYVICKNWAKYGKCKYGANCWNLHITNDNNNSFNNINSNNNKLFNNNQKETKEKTEEISEKKNQYFPEFSTYDNNNNYSNENDYYDSDIAAESDESDDSDFDVNNENNNDNNNNLYKKNIICRNWQKYGYCKYGAQCWYLHPKNNKNNNNNKINNDTTHHENQKSQEFSDENNFEFSEKNVGSNNDGYNNDRGHGDGTLEFCRL